MTFAKPTDTPGQPLNVIYAEHILQLIGVLTGQIDGGALQFLGQVAAPGTAPTVTLSAGALNGSYEWGTYWITGAADGTGSYAVTGRTTPSPYSATQNLANQQGTVSIAGQAVPTGVVGWGVVRNQAGGGTWYEVSGSEQFMNNAGVMPTAFVDNVADGNLVTAAPATNTTGTYLSGYLRLDSAAPNPQTVHTTVGVNNVTLPNGTNLADASTGSSTGGPRTFLETAGGEFDVLNQAGTAYGLGKFGSLVTTTVNGESGTITAAGGVTVGANGSLTIEPAGTAANSWSQNFLMKSLDVNGNTQNLRYQLSNAGTLIVSNTANTVLQTIDQSGNMTTTGSINSQYTTTVNWSGTLDSNGNATLTGLPSGASNFLLMCNSTTNSVVGGHGSSSTCVYDYTTIANYISTATLSGGTLTILGEKSASFTINGLVW